MTREEQLKEIENKFSTPIKEASDALNAAQLTYADLQSQKLYLENEVNEYFDALDKQAEIAPIIEKGVPKIK